MKTKKDKLAAKKDKAKAKKAKIKGVVIAALFAVFCGCSTSEPASRLTKAEYGDLKISVSESSNVTVNLTIGDGAYASADSDGSTETMTANPTNTTDIKPQTDVNTTGGRTAGILETAIEAGASLFKGDSSGSSNCAGGSCSPCEGGTCSDCTVK